MRDHVRTLGSRVPIRALAAGLLLTALMPATALAGMPVVTLHHLAKLRVEAISFFVVLLLLSAWGVQRLWNLLSRDFARLPWLSYRRALTLVVAWGLAFNLILTMIAGARELMTPGAWEREGLTYRIEDAAPLDAASGSASEGGASDLSGSEVPGVEAPGSEVPGVEAPPAPRAATEGGR